MAPPMPRPRKPNSLSAAERQRRYAQRLDLCTLKLSRPLLERLDEIARARSVSRQGALVEALDAWTELQRKAETANAGASPSEPAPRHEPGKPKRARQRRSAQGQREGVQQDLFAALGQPGEGVPMAKDPTSATPRRNRRSEF